MGRPKGSLNVRSRKICEKCKNAFMSSGKGHRFCGRPCSQTGYGTFGKKPKDPIKRFWDRIKKTDSCWNWTSHTRGGYGRMRRDFKIISVHRFSWEIHNGPVPDGLFVLHRCDNRVCVNPAHLWLGTYADNNRDRSIKGRNNHVSGSKHPKAKLTEQDVLKIFELRTAGMSYQKMAKRYGVDTRAVWQIFKGQTWKELFNKSAFSQNTQGEIHGTESSQA